ncbi:glycosyltransferase family 4 protein [Microbacterium sp. W4I20]|uniref:glycosyltransferase family 4 protein n=1 Tax=Microbacterium sp. W4I20 TaxID=3042262 RepID=UPI0027848282|nr:glycosyltransferase family 4 protein [Microbacterium sp. W4I20]MDQ0725937.1 glycosyltransferase involved in cell wall biosynthesis [Microbacterium sp. W4I20]
MPTKRRANRVTIISRIYAPEPSAASLRLQALADELVRREQDVRVLTSRPPRGIRHDAGTAETVARWPVLRDRAGYVRGYLQYMSFDIPLFFRMIFGRRADVYVVEPPPTTGTVARVATWLIRRPYVYYAADIWSDAAQMTGAAGWVIGVVRRLERFALLGAATDLVVSDGVISRIRTMAPGARMSPVGHGVDTDLFAPDGPRIDDAPDIVYAGTMSEWHGARVAVDALAILLRSVPSVKAVFIGQGSDRDALEASAVAQGIADRVTFLPPMPPEQAAAWIRSARVALATLQPGKGYDFAVPTKLYAALAVGTPVAYCGPEPLRTTIVEEQLGASAEFDAEAYAAAIAGVLAETDGRPDPHLVDWAHRNVSARSVAARAADAVLATVASRRGARRGAGRASSH